MAKIEGPLFSIGATGSIGDNLSIRSKGKLHVAQKYNKPGDKTPFESSPRQKDQRGIIGLITIYWECMTPAVKETWNKLAKSLRKPMTGYSYFIHMAQKNLLLYIGLVGYWSFNYNVGNQVYDLSGNNNHGTLKPSYPSNCPTLDSSINSKFGKALNFDGVNDYINCGSSNSLDDLKEVTYEYWVNHFYKGTEDMIHSKNNNYFGFISTNLLTGYIFLTGSNAYSRTLSIGLPNIWNHIVYTYSDTGDRTIHIYLNGIEMGYDILIPGSGTFISEVSFPLLLGTYFNLAYFLKGLIDEAHIWNRVLGLTEIQRHYDLFR